MASLKAFGPGSLIWAREKCREWNWNMNPAEIARELIDAEIKRDTDDMANVRRAFLDYFGDPDNDVVCRRALMQWEFIEQADEFLRGFVDTPCEKCWGHGWNVD